MDLVIRILEAMIASEDREDVKEDLIKYLEELNESNDTGTTSVCTGGIISDGVE